VFPDEPASCWSSRSCMSAGFDSISLAALARFRSAAVSPRAFFGEHGVLRLHGKEPDTELRNLFRIGDLVLGREADAQRDTTLLPHLDKSFSDGPERLTLGDVGNGPVNRNESVTSLPQRSFADEAPRPRSAYAVACARSIAVEYAPT
jgi:hypothetical protein